MYDTRLRTQRVAIVGAGVSGVVAAIHLKRAGLDVVVFERAAHVGGIWVYDERTSRDPQFPSVLPSVGDSPEFVVQPASRIRRHDSAVHAGSDGIADNSFHKETEDVSSSFAPPGPCYVALKNNVSTIEMELSCQRWKPGTDEFVPHHILAEYIQNAASANGVLSRISFNTRVVEIHKEGKHWKVESAELSEDRSTVTSKLELFDGVVVASGHYHACNVPEIDGLAAWKAAFPKRIFHSKSYRRPESFKGQNVLLIGAGVSSMDIAKDLGPYAESIYQSSRSGPYDLPAHMLPDNAARVSGIKSFQAVEALSVGSDGSIPGTVVLSSGDVLCNIHVVIVCTGYHVSFPFLKQYHADGVKSEDASDEVLVTDGQQTHNLHKDIFYIPDPTLAFVGVPYHVATFSLFEFQAMALAAVFSGGSKLPQRAAMRAEYNQRIKQKGAGRTFHSLKGYHDEVAYVNDLAETVTAGSVGEVERMARHSPKWLEAYDRRCSRGRLLFAQIRDPAKDARVLNRQGC